MNVGEKKYLSSRMYWIETNRPRNGFTCELLEVNQSKDGKNAFFQLSSDRHLNGKPFFVMAEHMANVGAVKFVYQKDHLNEGTEAGLKFLETRAMW